MNRIQSIGIAICTAAVVSVICVSLAPNRSLGRAVRVVAGLFLIFVIVSQFTGINFEYEKLAETAHDAYSSNDIIKSEVERTINDAIESALVEYGSDSPAVQASVNIGDDGGIYIERVEITLDSNDPELYSKAKSCALDYVGIEPEITIRETADDQG